MRDVFTGLWLGAKLCVAGDEELADGERLVDWLKREGVV